MIDVSFFILEIMMLKISKTIFFFFSKLNLLVKKIVGLAKNHYCFEINLLKKKK